MPGRKKPPDIDGKSALAYEDERVSFDSFLKNRGLKLTGQRKAIFREVFRIHGHVDADDIVANLKRSGEKVSRATVYRTLELLVDAELVKAVRPGTSQMYYEHAHSGEHHDHLVCVKCSRIFEFYSPEIEETQVRVCREKDFVPNRHTMIIYGTCRNCRRKGK